MSVVAPERNLKQPAEDLLFAFDFSALLEVGETLATVIGVTATPSGELTIETGSINGPTVEVRISGGVDGRDYKVECQVTTNMVNTRELDGYLLVRD